MRFNIHVFFIEPGVRESGNFREFIFIWAQKIHTFQNELITNYEISK